MKNSEDDLKRKLENKVDDLNVGSGKNIRRDFV